MYIFIVWYVNVLLFVVELSTVNVNNVNAKYFIGYFNGNEFPLSIDTCNPLDIQGANGFQKVECVDESTVYLGYYLNSACTQEFSNATYNKTFQTGVGSLFDFNCDDDAEDAYAEIEFAAFTCDTNTKVTMHAALDSCAYIYTDEVSIQVYCEPNWAQLYYFTSDDGTYCVDDNVYNVANATDECGFMLKTSGVKVYGQVMCDIQ